MAINNVITDDWSGHSHGEVEEALKDKLSEMSQGIKDAAQAGYAPPAGGIPYSDLAKAVRDTLDLVSDKVDKVNGKGLSTEDFTSAFKAKLESLGNYDDTQIRTAVATLQSTLDGLATVATSGSYNDLKDKPVIPEGLVPDNEMSAMSDNVVKNKVIKAYVDNLINGLVNGAPAALDTLKELADKLGDNDDAVAALTNLINTKANDNEVVKSITVNGQTQTPTNGNVNLGTITKGDDGKNAFELAQQNGYEGTLEQWLQSMAENAGFSYTEDSTTIYVQDALHYDSTPRISINETNIRLSPVVGSTVTKTIVIKGYNLSTPITISLVDNNGFYSIDKQTLPVSGGNIILTYHPTEGGTHNATVVISSGQDAEGVVSVVGETAAPTINVDKSSLELKSESGQSATATFRVTGVSLSDMVNISVNGSGYTVSPNFITANQAINGVDVVVTYDGSSGDGTATITLSSTGAENVIVNAVHTAVQRLPVGSTITSYQGFVFTVLEPVTDSNNNTIYPVSVKGSGTSGDVTIPSTVTDENGFEYTVRSIEFDAFKGLPNLTGITIPSTVKVWLGGTGGFAGYSQAFNNCTGLTKVKFEIGSRGFSLSSAFFGCTKLKDIDFGDLTYIPGNNTFQNCNSLVDLLIPNTVTSIGNNLNAPKLKRVQLGTDGNCQITTINNAFGGISTLECIICYATTPPSFGTYESLQYGGGLSSGMRNFDSSNPQNGTSFDTNGTGRLYVPSSAVNSYKSAGGWSRMVGNTNYSGDSDGRIYAIEDIGTIAGHESDALITTNQNNS